MNAKMLRKALKGLNQLAKECSPPAQVCRAPNEVREIDTKSDEWAVFCGHWFVRNGFNPHPLDSRVVEAWEWFLAGQRWGETRK